MTDLHCIVYTSSATHLLNQGEIEHLLERARQRNLEKGVTGLLLYCEGSFMQYIEGPHPGLMEIYKVILHDPLHHMIIELMNGPIRNREFADWAMAYSQVQEAGLASLLDLGWDLKKSGPPDSSASRGKRLLVNFWRNHHRFSN